MARHASQPHLRMNAHGYYAIYWTESGRSKRITTGKDNHIDAAAFFAQWLRERHLPTPAGEAWNVRMLLDIYYAEQIERGPSAWRTRIIVSTLKRAFGTMLPEHIDASVIQRYERERGEGLHGKRKAGSATVRRELTVLIAALNHAVRQRRISADQLPHIDRPEDSDARDVVIPPDHMEIIFSNATGRLRDFIFIAHESAQRRGAVEGLRWRQVRIRDKIINFQPSGGSGSKAGVSIPMSDRLFKYIPGIGTHGGMPSPRDFVLGNNSSVYPAWVALMKRLAQQTGDDAFLDYVPHDLRRTWATRAAQRGVDLWSIAGVLGDSLAVVTKHYAKHQPEHLRHAVK